MKRWPRGDKNRVIRIEAHCAENEPAQGLREAFGSVVEGVVLQKRGLSFRLSGAGTMDMGWLPWPTAGKSNRHSCHLFRPSASGSKASAEPSGADRSSNRRSMEKGVKPSPKHDRRLGRLVSDEEGESDHAQAWDKPIPFS